jgi:hypothetical protein
MTDQGNSAGSQAASGHPAADVRFERLLSFRPLLTAPMHGKEPCIRDMIHFYYSLGAFDEMKSDALTKEYIAKLYEANL